MALPIITDTFRVTLNWTGSGVGAHNVMHVHSSTLDEAGVYNAINSAVTASMWDGVRATQSVDSVEVLKLDGTTAGLIFPTARPAKWSGVQATGDYSVVESIVVSLRTAVRGPRGRGRLFLPFPAESAVTNGFLNTGNNTTMTGAWNLFLVNLVGCELVVASYKHATQAQVGVVLVDPVIHAQRRRAKQLH